MNRPDLLVAGAGPAGLAAAITASQAGLSVTLLERAEEAPAPKPSPPESLPPGCESLMAHLGLAEAYAAAGFPPFRGICARGEPKDFGGDAAGPWLGRHVDRGRLDAMLRARAADCGVRFVKTRPPITVRREGARVTGADGGGDACGAPWTVDATGRAQWLGRELGLRRVVLSRRLVAWRGTADGPLGGPAADYAFLDADPAGWWWTAQTHPGRWVWTRLSSGPDKPDVRDAPHGLSGCCDATATDVTWRLRRPAAGEGWLLAGDAAAILDPAAGNGVFFALHSGVQAARTAAEALARPRQAARAAAVYDGWLADTFHTKARRLADWYQSAGLNGLVRREAA